MPPTISFSKHRRARTNGPCPAASNSPGAQPGSLSGKRRQAFANGFLSLQGFGRSTFAAVADIGAQEREDLETALARHFVAVYGAPDLDTALPAAREEIGFICDLVADAPINTVFTVRRFHDDDGEIREEYRTVAPPSAPTHTRIWDVVDDHDA